MIENIIIGFAFFVTSIVFHELGHFFIAHRQGLKPKIIFTGTRLYTESLHQPLKNLKMYFYEFGIVAGFVPLFIGLFVNFETIIFIPLYFIGIVSDIKQMVKL